jgi:HSP20 family protein
MTYYTYALPRRTSRHWLASAGRGIGHRTLRLNVRDEGDAFVVTAPVPGLKASDLKVQVLDDVLQIDGEFPTGEGEFLLQEIRAGSFRREITLPSSLDTDKVEARVAEGLLTLRLPKAESSRPRAIKIAAN